MYCLDYCPFFERRPWRGGKPLIDFAYRLAQGLGPRPVWQAAPISVACTAALTLLSRTSLSLAPPPLPHFLQGVHVCGVQHHPCCCIAISNVVIAGIYVTCRSARTWRPTSPRCPSSAARSSWARTVSTLPQLPLHSGRLSAAEWHVAGRARWRSCLPALCPRLPNCRLRTAVFLGQPMQSVERIYGLGSLYELLSLS